MKWPSWVMDRRRADGGLTIETILKDGTSLSVDCNESNPPLFIRKAMLQNLGSAVFEHEYPGQVSQLHMRLAVCALNCQEPAPNDAKMMARLDELTKR